MLDKIQAVLTPARRKWAYGVTCAGVAILTTYRVLDGDQAAAWLYLAAAVLGMATGKTDTTTPDGMPRGGA
jgi:hypothetical protein